MDIIAPVDRQPFDSPSSAADSPLGPLDLSINAASSAPREGSPLSPPLRGLTDALEPACRTSGQQLKQMVSIKTGVPVLITPGERQRCYGICADDMLTPQDQFDTIKVHGLIKEARSLALNKRASRMRHLRNALAAAGHADSAAAPGPAARALADQADRAEEDLAAEVAFWRALRVDVDAQLRQGTPAMTIICQFSADRIFLR